MEIDEFKAAWSQYDKKLTQNLRFNEEILRKMNLEKSKKELQKPLFYEISGVVIGFVCTVLLASISIRLVGEPKYAIPGFLASFIGVAFTVFSIIKTNRFMSIDYYGSSVLKLQKDVALLNKLVLVMRKFELLFFPLLAIPAVIVIIKFLYNIDLYTNTLLFIIEVVFIFVVGYPLLFWINKQLYDKKFKNTELFLKEIKEYEEEV